MKTRALLLALPLVALAGCRDNRATIQAQGVCFPNQDCTVGAICDKIATGLGVLDVSIGHSFVLFIQLGNPMSDNSSPGSGRLNTHNAHVDQISVEYEGIGLPRWVYNPINQTVLANGTTVMAVNVVSPLNGNTAALLDAAVPAGAAPRPLAANIRFRGYFDDGSRFETGEFSTGLQVCNGCLPFPQCGAGKAACPTEGMEPASCTTTG